MGHTEALLPAPAKLPDASGSADDGRFWHICSLSACG